MTGLGTFAEAMTCDQSSIVKIETSVTDDQLALIGCGVTTGVGAALNTAQVHPGSTVAVIGCGGVGQAVIQGARIAGASRIIAVDPVEMKRKTAEQLGATDFVDPNEGDPVAQVQQLTSGRGVDYAFEVIGLPETTLQAFNMIRKGGTAVMVGMTRAEATVTLSTFDLFFNEKTLKGCKYGSGQVRRDFQRYADLIETGRLDTEALVSRTIKLDEVNEAFRDGSGRGHPLGHHHLLSCSVGGGGRRTHCGSGPAHLRAHAALHLSFYLMWPGKHALERPSHPAYVMAGTGQVVTYAELNDRSNQFAELLFDAGLRFGDHIAVLMENRAEFFEVAGPRSGRDSSSRASTLTSTRTRWHTSSTTVTRRCSSSVTRCGRSRRNSSTRCRT